MTIVTPMVFTGGIAAGGSTWSPTDKSAFISLSGGDLTATALGGGPGDSLIRGTLSQTSGKLYFEIQTFDRIDGETAMGVANSTASVNNFLGADNNSIGMYQTGHVFIGGVQVLTGPTFVVTDFIGIAVDFGGNLIWWRNNNAPTVWNAGGTADPATGVGGQSIAAITGPFFICGDIPVQPGQQILNVGNSSFNQSPPAGFSDWG